MLVFTLRRLAAAIPVLLILSVMIFMLIHLAPGDPVTILLPETATESDIAETRAKWGLDRPLYVQYGLFVARLIRGDMGHSFYFGEQVSSLLAGRLPATLELAAVAIVISMLVSIPIGILSAVRQNSAIDNLGMTGALFGISMPGFWFGILLIMLFAGQWRLFPASGRLPDNLYIERTTGFLLFDTLLAFDLAGFLATLRHLILPAVTIGLQMAGILARLTRSSLLDVIREDYVQVARAKGLGERLVIWRHAFRNALIPIVTVLGLQLGSLLSGAIIVETIFAWPGVGRLLMQGVGNRDYAVVESTVLVFGLFYMLLNLLVDITYGLLDPRIRYS